MELRAYPLPPDETARLQSLADTRLLDEPANARFDRIVRLAADLTGVPIAAVTLIDEQFQHAAAAVGMSRDPLPRGDGFCTYTILHEDLFVVEDAREDPLLADSPLVTGPSQLRFYAGAPLRASDGRHVGAVCIADTAPRSLDAKGQQILRDLAETAAEEIKSRRLVEQYAAAAAERDGLVRALAHDLRSPLGGIAGLAELLTDLVPAGSEAAELTGAIAEAAEAALKVAASTLARAVSSAQPAPAEPPVVDLAALTAEVAVVHQPAAVAKRQRIVVEGTPALTHGDPVRLHHALANLVSNALKFSPSHSTVTVRTGTDAGGAWVTVEDQGPGLGDADPVRLFEPFERGPARPTAGEPSTGLGLSIVRDLARLHGGDVRAETVPAGGARFTFSLPVSKAAPPVSLVARPGFA